MSDHKQVEEQNIFFLEEQELELEDFLSDGLVLDVGGGGSGVIGQLKGPQAVAIDLLLSELEEAPQGPLKIVMDAKELKFMDETFSAATAFFSMMYINKQDRLKVFKEVWRVLKTNGSFYIWDLEIPEKSEGNKDVIAVKLRLRLPKTKISTGYGISWPRQGQSVEEYEKMAVENGFKVVRVKKQGLTFFMEIRKTD